MMQYDFAICEFFFEFFHLNASVSNNEKENNSNDIKYLADLCYRLESNLIYFFWLISIFTPLFKFFLCLFLTPFIISSYFYVFSLILTFKKHWLILKKAYSEDIWKGSYKSFCVFWETQGIIWHGHEIIGFENIPDKGPGLLVYYHAAIPIDFYYVYSKTCLYKNRLFKVVADKLLFKVPGLKMGLDTFNVTPGTVDSCTSILKDGNLLAISPGGLREGLFSDQNYNLIWGKRCGFAKSAIASKAPVIPMFTKNSREAIRTVTLFRRFFRFLYEYTKLPMVPIYGIFPVKMITYIGKPIEYQENRTVEELVELTKQSIEELIKKHQRVPGNIFRALYERFAKTKEEE